MPVHGFRIGKFSYLTDTNLIPDQTLDLLKGTDTLVLNALQRERHISHFNLEEALAVIEKVQPRKAYFTHISHKLGLHTEVEQELPPNIRLAYDGLKINVD
jgi:phosphoribosyl 1,2-cyclic phosphate phosphodiesterase